MIFFLFANHVYLHSLELVHPLLFTLLFAAFVYNIVVSDKTTSPQTHSSADNRAQELKSEGVGV